MKSLSISTNMKYTRVWSQNAIAVEECEVEYDAGVRGMITRVGPWVKL